MVCATNVALDCSVLVKLTLTLIGPFVAVRRDNNELLNVPVICPFVVAIELD